MATPISNHGSSVINNNQTARSEERKESGQSGANQEAAPAVTSTGDDSVKLSRTAEILSQARTDQGQSKIHSPEQAAEFAQQLKAQIAANPAQAMAGQSKGVSEDILALLNAG